MSADPLLHRLDAAEAVALQSAGQATALGLAECCLARIAEREPRVQAFVRLDADGWRAAARAADARAAGASALGARHEAARGDDAQPGAARGPLHGIPVAVKDLFDVAGWPTRCGSPVTDDAPAAADAEVVRRLRAAGALVVGKTVTTEFAYFEPGPTRHPRDATRTPGGSSSGSAAAVADAMLPLALGTQTAASVIRPAAFCGVVGFKPSFGSVPRDGVRVISPSLDTVGGFARSVQDVALLMAVLAGRPEWAAAGAAPASAPGAEPRLAWCDGPPGCAPSPATAAALAALRARLQGLLGDLPVLHAPDLAEAQRRLMTFEMARALHAERVRGGDRLSARLRSLIDEGLALTDADRAQALATRDAAQRALQPFWSTVDAVLAPATVGEAPLFSEGTGDPLPCRGWTLLGLPCVSLPLTVSPAGLPLAVQLVGAPGGDAALLSAARWLEDRIARWHHATPAAAAAAAPLGTNRNGP